jgi:hypothetical protein
MRSNPEHPTTPAQGPPPFNKKFLPPPPSTPLETPVFTISSRPAEPASSQSRQIQPASFYPPPDLEKATYIPKVYSVLFRANGFSALGRELRYVWDLNRFRWYNDEHDDYFGPPGASDKPPKPYVVSVDPRLYSSQTAGRSTNLVMHLSSRDGPLPHCLNPQFVMPSYWTLKPAGGKFAFETPQSGIDGSYASPFRLLYAPRSPMYHGVTTAPSISFLMGSGLPPLIYNLANNEERGIICDHDHPLFTPGPRKGTMMILHQVSSVLTLTRVRISNIHSLATTPWHNYAGNYEISS